MNEAPRISPLWIASIVMVAAGGGFLLGRITAPLTTEAGVGAEGSTGSGGVSVPARRKPSIVHAPDVESRLPKGARRPVEQLRETKAVGTVENLLAAIEALRNEGEENPRAFTELLESLVALGSAEAIGAVLDLMQDATFDFAHRATEFARLLGGVDDPRIASAATAVLEANLVDGLDSWVYTGGYMKLIAMTGGANGAAVVLDHLQGGVGKVPFMAIQAVGTLEDRSLRSEFLQAARDLPAALGRSLIEALAHWEDPDVDRALLKMARDASIDIGRRGDAWRAHASYLKEGELSGFSALYLQQPSEADRLAFLEGLSGAANNQRVPVAVRRKTLDRAILEGLSAGSDAERSRTLLILSNQPEMITSRHVGFLDGYPGMFSTAELDRYRRRVLALYARAH